MCFPIAHIYSDLQMLYQMHTASRSCLCRKSNMQYSMMCHPGDFVTTADAENVLDTTN